MTGRAVLVVDPDRKVRARVRSVLRAAGYRVFEAASALEALVICACRPIELLLTELELGGISGAELARAVGERFPTVAVVGMGVPESLAAGETMRERLAKPLDNECLKACVERLLQAPPRKQVAGASTALRWFEKRGAG